MENYFETVKGYLLELDYEIVSEDESEGIVVIDNEDEGIKNMILDVEDPILIMEQYLFTMKKDSMDIYKALLKKNRDVIHGAFVLDEENRVIFRDTLQVENLDLNELEGSLNSLKLLMSEYAHKVIEFASA